MNFSSNVNLMRLKAQVANVGGKECIILPIEDNDLYCTRDGAGNVKGVFLSFTHWENRQPSRFGDTHAIKQGHGKEWREAHGQEQQPYIGQSKPLGQASVRPTAQPAPQPAPQPVAPSQGVIDWDNMQS